MKVLFTIISINKCETKRTLTLKVVDEDMYTFVTFLCTYYWKDHKHTDKNKMTVRDLKKWCWLSYCSPKHCFVRRSGKCSEYHRLDGAGAVFSSFASFHYVEELQLLLVKFLRPTLSMQFSLEILVVCFKESLVSHVPAKDRKSMKKHCRHI